MLEQKTIPKLLRDLCFKDQPEVYLDWALYSLAALKHHVSFFFINLPLNFYRKHPDGLSARMDVALKIEEIGKVYNIQDGIRHPSPTAITLREKYILSIQDDASQ